ncbi:MAG: LCP family protein [Clostridiales bacterium]|nr:LCP family protein [Clostridiales bacterium]
MFYEPYRKKRTGKRGQPERRGGCGLRLFVFLLKLLFRLALLLLALAVVAFALPPGLFNVEPRIDLSIAPGLPDTHVNILLLGVDNLNGGAQRSDSMMILSIGYNSVKLTSILRDTVVEIPGHGSDRINAAYSYGGAELAMRTVNRAFRMNITKYAVADFLTLAKLIDAVGGVDIPVSEAEMREINHNNWRVLSSPDEAEAALGYAPRRLERYSRDGAATVRLDGLQALGYARIRKLDSDFVRASRQRRVFNAAISSVKRNIANPVMYARLVNVALRHVKTNLGAVEIASLLAKALVRGEAEQLRIPVEGSYRDSGSRIAIDQEKNTEALHKFIYG